jgi:hypothetical protein
LLDHHSNEVARRHFPASPWLASRVLMLCRMNARIFLSALAGTLLAAHTAAADTDAAATAPSDVQWFTHAGGVGAVGGGGHAGALVGGTVLVRRDLLAVGATFEASGLFSMRVGGAATAGLSYRDPSGFGADLLGAIGVHAYSGVGKGLFSDDPGASATLPYASARARGVYVFGSARQHFQLGIGATFDQDLTRVTRSYSYTDNGSGLGLWGNEKSETRTTRHSVGFATIALMVDAGMTFDVL